MRIACIGEAMIEIAPAGPDMARIGVAGDTFNTAVYLRRALGPGDGVAYVTALGDEAMSARILAALEAEGIDTALIERRAGMMPGLYAISVDETGERSFSYWRSAAAARTLFSPPCTVTPERLAGFDYLYLSGISLAILPQSARDALAGWLPAFRAAGGRVAFDGNFRPRLWEDAAAARRETMRLWALADIALPSLDDELALFGEADEAAVIARLAAAGVRAGALKRGPAGPRALDGSGAVLSVAPVRDVVDTTAAGDSFNAGFLAAMAAGQDTLAAMAAGHALAAEVIRHPGAIMARA